MKSQKLVAQPSVIGIVLLSWWALSGCSTPTAVDRHFGQAVKNAQSGQTWIGNELNRPLVPSTTDAGVVRSSIARYDKSFITPPTPVSSLDQSLGTSSNTAPR